MNSGIGLVLMGGNSRCRRLPANLVHTLSSGQIQLVERPASHVPHIVQAHTAPCLTRELPHRSSNYFLLSSELYDSDALTSSIPIHNSCMNTLYADQLLNKREYNAVMSSIVNS